MLEFLIPIVHVDGLMFLAHSSSPMSFLTMYHTLSFPTYTLCAYPCMLHVIMELGSHLLYFSEHSVIMIPLHDRI
jgi:hypothetical protein